MCWDGSKGDGGSYTAFTISEMQTGAGDALGFATLVRQEGLKQALDEMWEARAAEHPWMVRLDGLVIQKGFHADEFGGCGCGRSETGCCGSHQGYAVFIFHGR